MGVKKNLRSAVGSDLFKGSSSGSCISSMLMMETSSTPDGGDIFAFLSLCIESVTVDPVTSKKAPQSGPQEERESARSATNSESRPSS